MPPFVTYTTLTAWSFSATAEVTYDWERNEASVPVALMVGKVFAIGRQPSQTVAGPRYYVSHFDNGARGRGATLNLILLFPQQSMPRPFKCSLRQITEGDALCAVIDPP